LARNPMSRAYVVCAFCGARIRADRGRCLRCGEALHAASAPAQAGPTLREWLQTPSGRNVAAAAALAMLVGVVAFMNSGAPAKGARPLPGVTKPSPQTGSQGRTAASRPLPQGELMAPATAGDSVRLAGAAFTSGDFEAAKVRYEQALQRTADERETQNGLGLS